ncbi:MAG: pyruvate kinase [Xanthomonadaceae bacterium]|nr:pyruvate kinase [Xanthomonadaceae bacterium]
MNTRRTKIVATLGPATDDVQVLDGLIVAGIDCARVNFSHGTAADQKRRVEQVRARAAALGRDVGVLADLQGPKIRVEKFRDGPVELVDGKSFVLDASLGPDDGTIDAVGITYKDLPSDVQPQDILLLNDGLIALTVDRVDGPRIHTVVLSGGELSNGKGINRQGGGLSAGALTEKDRADIKTAAMLGCDYVAVSFPRTAADIEEARTLLNEAGSKAGIVAKIERAVAVVNIEEITRAADVVMIARGDLGVEIGDAELPGVQKNIVHLARELNTACITATQMMESMVANPVPTRAEVLDVANAVMDGTDAVMLSAETASGRYPVKAVQAMARVCEGAERQRMTQRSSHRIDQAFVRTDEAVAMATMYTANHLGVRAILALTESGSTALWMSRIRSGIPIYALTRHEATRRRVTLYRGVYPVAFDVVDTHPARVTANAIDKLLEIGAVADGDRVIITKGELSGIAGGTNSLKIMRVGDHRLTET